MLQFNATIVFEKIWNAINEKNDDGSRKYKYIINTGSSRSSKTYSILQAHYLYAITHENKRISIWRETKQDTKNTVLADFKKAIVNFPLNNGIIFNKTESIYTFKNKSTIEICGGDDDNRVHGFQGNVAHFNEPYKISKEVFDQIDMRTSDYIIIDWNPKKGHWIDDISKYKNAIVIHSTYKDNPFCPPEQKFKIESYQPVSMSKVVIDKIMNEIEAKEYDCFKNELNLKKSYVNELLRCQENENKNSANLFNWQVYGLGLKSEKPNRVFSNWTEISYNNYLKINATKYIGVDWGKVDPWGIIELKYYDGAIYIHELNYKSENEIRQELSQNEKQNLHNFEISNEQGQEYGIVQYYFNKLGIEKNINIICDTNRPLKIAALRRLGYDFAQPSPNKSILDGIDLIDNLKVYYTSNSLNLKHEYENYSRKVDKYGVILEDPEDFENHLIDPLRYIVLFLQKIRVLKSI